MKHDCTNNSSSGRSDRHAPQQGKKPWLTVAQQIECLKDKGIDFNRISEEDAALYLSRNNNYFRLGSYRKTFPRYSGGEKDGQFINLDFATLVDLSVIDMLLRRQILPMALDVEHFEKMKLLSRIEDEGEDGYQIISDYIGSNDRKSDQGRVSNRVKDSISRGESSPYVADLIAKYSDYAFPAWAFMEVIPFGTFVDFYRFCSERFSDKRMLRNYYVLQKVRSIRNACAHNNCILNNLRANTSPYRIPDELSMAISKVEGIGKGARKSRLSNERLLEITAVLYKHVKVASPGVHEHRSKELNEFKERMLSNVEYYNSNMQMTSSFEYLAKLIDHWYRC